MADSLVGELNQNKDAMGYPGLLSQASEQWDLNPDKLEDLMNRIAFHESKNIPESVQEGGPGRGLYQFETGVGEGGQTAGQRLVNQLGYTPDWLDISEEGLDASKLNEEQQKMLFLANYLQKPGKSSGMYGITEENLPEWWAQHHWAGPSEEKEERLSSFKGDMNVYGL